MPEHRHERGVIVTSALIARDVLAAEALPRRRSPISRSTHEISADFDGLDGVVEVVPVD